MRTRTRFWLLIAAAIAAISGCGGGGGDGTPYQPDAKIYVAREIVTMDPRRPSAEAVAVVGERILAVGTLAEVEQSIAGNRRYSVDRSFADKVLVPGFIAQHLHPMLAAITMESAVIANDDWMGPRGLQPGVSGRDNYLRRMREVDAGLPADSTPLFTWGFSEYFHGGPLVRSDLDRLVNAKRPIIVWHRSAHSFILNSAALDTYHLDAKWKGGLDPEVQANIDLETGRFWEKGMFAILPKLIDVIATPQRMGEGLVFLRGYLHANGVTAGAEPGGIVDKRLQDAQNLVFGPPETPFRFYYIPDGKTMGEEHAKGKGEIIPMTEALLSWGSGNTAFLPRQAKLFADGAIFSQAMKLRDGYLDDTRDHPHTGEWMMDESVFENTFATYWDAGYQIHIHQNGDGGLDRVLKSIEAGMARHPRSDHRTVIVHFGIAAPDQVESIRRLGAIVSANPNYVTALADRFGEIGVGQPRADQMVRLGDLEAAGIRYSLHDDMPMAPSKPLFLMHAAVNRTTVSGRVAGPNQRASREAALRALTIEAAYSLQLENEIGSVEPGKKANFTVLAANPLTVPADAIKDIAIWGTVHEGRALAVPKTASAAGYGWAGRVLPGDDDGMLAAGAPDLHDHAGDVGCLFGARFAAAVGERTLAALFQGRNPWTTGEPSARHVRATPVVPFERRDAAGLPGTGLATLLAIANIPRR